MTGILFCGQIYFTIQGRGFSDQLRQHCVGRIFEAGLNPVLFKSIYQLPVMPETLKEWCEWAQKLDWQYRQKQTESKLLGHSHMTHKPCKTTGGGHKKAQAQASVWVQPLANAVTPNAHVPQMHQHQPQNSNTMDVD